MKCGYTGCLGDLTEPRPARSFEVLSHNPETGEMWPSEDELVGEGFYVAKCTRCQRGYRSLDGVNFFCGVDQVLQAQLK